MPNFVKDQFPSESLSSFQTSVTTAATAGPANTTAATLSNLAQSMENTPVGASVNVSHSVPNPLGNITSFAATIQQINEKLQQDPNNGKRYLEALANDDPIRAAKYNEWLGLCDRTSEQDDAERADEYRHDFPRHHGRRNGDCLYLPDGAHA